MKRARSLFTRLLTAQVLVMIVLTTMLAALFYAERNRSVIQLVALRWAPALRLVAGGAPIEAARARAPGPLYAASERPAKVLQLAALTPRLAMVRDALIEEGLPIVDLALAPESTGHASVPTLWLALRGAEGATRWVGFESAVIETRLRERLLLAIVLLLGLAVIASTLIARRLVRPLEVLRARIAADDTAGVPLANASAEVQAIDGAWRTLRQSLERQERERASLLAGVSHDLRSPLGRIRMAAELLPESEGVAPRREIIVRNAALADRLVGSFLDHVRSGELPLDETVDVAAVARAAATQQQRGAAELMVETPASLMVPRTNAVLIERMIANLLDNAFTHGQSPVTLRVSAWQNAVHLEIEDAGGGIAPDQQAAMLQAFARADSSRQRPGLGLGLAVAQRVALRMDGSVSFTRSADGQRHLVRVAWPLSKA
jgi:two-component system, OmpR family, osmolarity sensor histidine kinase EnvZ